MQLCLMLGFVVSVFGAQAAKEGTAGDAKKIVTIKQIVVEGSRLQPPSVMWMTQLRVGDEVDFAKVHTATQKLTQSGLIKHVEFEYESVAGKEKEVTLYLKCTDEPPGAKVSIQIDNVAEDEVWNWLTQLDPLFTREMPPNEAASRFYANWIGKYMEKTNPKFAEDFAVIVDATDSAGGTTPDRLVFKVTKRRGAK